MSVLQWVEWAEPIAYGALALKPWEFSKLQPQEFIALLQGYTWRKEQQEELLAYFTAGIMNLFGRSLVQPITPEELISPIRNPGENEDRVRDEVYLRETFKELLK